MLSTNSLTPPIFFSGLKAEKTALEVALTRREAEAAELRAALDRAVHSAEAAAIQARVCVCVCVCV